MSKIEICFEYGCGHFAESKAIGGCYFAGLGIFSWLFAIARNASIKQNSYARKVATEGGEPLGWPTCSSPGF